MTFQVFSSIQGQNEHFIVKPRRSANVKHTGHAAAPHYLCSLTSAPRRGATLPIWTRAAARAPIPCYIRGAAALSLSLLAAPLRDLRCPGRDQVLLT